MHFHITTCTSLIVLTIVDLCLSAANFDATNSKLNGGHITNRYNEMHAKSEFLIGASDKSENKPLRRKSDRLTASSGEHPHADSDHQNFLITNYLSDGEIERRIHFNGITAKETLVSNSGSALSLWQLSYRDTFIQMIYSADDEILDCDFLTGWSFSEEFVQKFYEEIQRMRSRNDITGLDGDYQVPKFRHHSRHHKPEIDMTMDSENEISGASNVTYRPMSKVEDIPKDLKRIMDFGAIKSQCDAYHQKVMHMTGASTDESIQNATEHWDRRKRALSDWMIVPNTKWCGRGQTADTYSQLGGASKADKCCRRHDHCKFNIYALTTKWHLFNLRPFTISHCSCDMRRRRDLTNFLRIPGTKWCGKGYSAKKYAELGARSKADRCCRQHDKACPFWIMGFETKYGLFNWRINTLMHCKCDERFRTCLKMADSSDATMVGKLFFNIIQTKCFVLKPENYCKKRAWWGVCESEGVRKRAHLRNNKKF